MKFQNQKSALTNTNHLASMIRHNLNNHEERLNDNNEDQDKEEGSDNLSMKESNEGYY